MPPTLDPIADGVRIRPFQTGDAPLLHEAALESVETVHPWLEWCRPGYASEEARIWVERQIVAFRNRSEYQFAITTSDGRFLGGCGLNAFDDVHRRANLGYWVRRGAAGCGVATAAIPRLVHWAFMNTHFNRLEVVIATGNAGSLRVAEKTGALREGVLRSRLMLHGAPCDAVMFSFIRGADEPERRGL
ncbi:MAG: GNAT family N-acetyltransferase [Acidobacteriota bacterium]